MLLLRLQVRQLVQVNSFLVSVFLLLKFLGRQTVGQMSEGKLQVKCWEWLYLEYRKLRRWVGREQEQSQDFVLPVDWLVGCYLNFQRELKLGVQKQVVRCLK